VKIPDWVEKFIVLPLLLYRRLRYGYAFRRIPLTQGKFAIVDPDDYERLNQFKWLANGSRKNLYAQRMITKDGKRVLLIMHREIIKVPDNMVVDHINHNGLDNRKANLRPATIAQNGWNRRLQSHSCKFKGVTWNKREKKWRACLRHAGKNMNIGTFDNEIEAARAYDTVAKNFRGHFAVLNFPD
jgi:hypothetical protein